MVKGIVIVVLYLTSLFLILFLAAGRIDWPMAWIALGGYAVISFVNLGLVDRDLVVERSLMGRGARCSDVLLASLSFLFFLPFTLAVAGLDAGRFSWSPPLGLYVQCFGLIAFLAGNGVGSWAMIRNRYFSTFVRIQDNRAHQVVTGGPYEYVRHPGYAGIIVSALALPLALGSLWALIPGAIGAGGFVLRTALEDRILMDELVGYLEYAKAVRYRLLPGIW
jgi:protein-S-isoprenylcysteine O-methyltransferase Ste14